MTEETTASDSSALSRREAIYALLAECEAAGHPPITDEEVAEFRRAVGWDPK